MAELPTADCNMIELLTVDCDCCPVCEELFSEPKLLPCAHTICRNCVLLWLRKSGWKGSCPLCRTPILSEVFRQQCQQSDHDLTKPVDELPTDQVTAGLAHSKRVLRAPHTCDICEDFPPAESFCFQCDVKLCSSCTRDHKKIPATRDHDLHELRSLTPEGFATFSSVRCTSHVDKMADLYCPDHRVVICMQCATKFSHKRCPNVDGIEHFGSLGRKRLEDSICCLRDKERELEREIRCLETVKTKVNMMSAELQIEVNEKFDKMARTVAARRQELLDRIKASECEVARQVTSAKSRLETRKAVLAAHAYVGERMVAKATDGGILSGVDKLEDRLKNLEMVEWEKLGSIHMEVVNIDQTTFDRTQCAVAELGQLTSSLLEATTLRNPRSVRVSPSCACSADEVWCSTDPSPLPGNGAIRHHPLNASSLTSTSSRDAATALLLTMPTAKVNYEVGVKGSETLLNNTANSPVVRSEARVSGVTAIPQIGMFPVPPVDNTATLNVKTNTQTLPVTTCVPVSETKTQTHALQAAKFSTVSQTKSQIRSLQATTIAPILQNQALSVVTFATIPQTNTQTRTLPVTTSTAISQTKIPTQTLPVTASAAIPLTSTQTLPITTINAMSQTKIQNQALPVTTFPTVPQTNKQIQTVPVTTTAVIQKTKSPTQTIPVTTTAVIPQTQILPVTTIAAIPRAKTLNQALPVSKFSTEPPTKTQTQVSSANTLDTVSKTTTQTRASPLTTFTTAPQTKAQIRPLAAATFVSVPQTKTQNQMSSTTFTGSVLQSKTQTQALSATAILQTITQTQALSVTNSVAFPQTKTEPDALPANTFAMVLKTKAQPQPLPDTNFSTALQTTTKTQALPATTNAAVPQTNTPVQQTSTYSQVLSSTTFASALLSKTQIKGVPHPTIDYVPRTNTQNQLIPPPTTSNKKIRKNKKKKHEKAKYVQ